MNRDRTLICSPTRIAPELRTTAARSAVLVDGFVGVLFLVWADAVIGTTIRVANRTSVRRFKIFSSTGSFLFNVSLSVLSGQAKNHHMSSLVILLTLNAVRMTPITRVWL